MSISSEIARLQQAKADLATSIANKGVTVPAATTLDGYAALVDSIGGGSLPYDAEVEYIEKTSSATRAYINTGFKPNQNTSVRIVVSMPIVTSSRFFETRDSVGSKEYAIINFGSGSSGLQIRYNTQTSITARSKLDTNTIYDLFWFKRYLFVNDLYVKDLGSATFQCSYPLVLFGLNSGGSITTGDALFRLHSCKIYDNNVLVRDYIPVRVEQVGYLYDKVSGNLVGNSGSGSFVLGNDIT